MRRIPIVGFKGINNVESDTYLTRYDDVGRLRAYLPECNNIDIGNHEEIMRADGYTKLLNFTNAHSLWMFDSLGYGLFVENNNLRILRPSVTASDFTTSILRTDLYSGNPLYCLNIYDRIFYSDGIVSGIVKDGVSMEWGLIIPVVAYLISTGGHLRAGTYRIALTYVRYDGVESGASQIRSITISDYQGISIFYDYPLDVNIMSVNIYASAPDGEELYLVHSIDKNIITNLWTTQYNYIDEELTMPLDKIGLNKPPAGQVFELYNQRIFIGQENVLYYTEPLQYELYHESFNFIPFDSKITMILASGSGLYVSTTRNIYYLSGNFPEQFTYKNIYEYGVYFGLYCSISGEEVNLEGIDFYAVTDIGIIAGSNGKINNISENYFKPGQIDESGWSLYRRHKDLRQVVFAYQANLQQIGEIELPMFEVSGTFF